MNRQQLLTGTVLAALCSLLPLVANAEKADRKKKRKGVLREEVKSPKLLWFLADSRERRIF